MRCPHCDSINPEQAIECGNCGAPLVEKDKLRDNPPEGIPADAIELPDPSPHFSADLFSKDEDITVTNGNAADKLVSTEDQESLDEMTALLKKAVEPEKDGSAIKVKPGRELAILLEILPGLFGILGLGWLYAGNKKVGVALLIGFLLWDILVWVLAFSTSFLVFLCILPLNILIVIVSVLMLNGYFVRVK